jgi:serine/threonine-protein kinase
MSENKQQVDITPQAVREQLAAILASESFVRSRRMQRFLEFIVEETLAGRADQLGEYSIGLSVFDRGTDFEPALDPIVRNDARRLRLKLFEYYRPADTGNAARVLILMPKGGYVPVFERIQDNLSKRLAVLPFEVLSPASESAICGRALCHSLTANLNNLDGLEVVAPGYLGERPIREAASELHLSHAIHGSVLRSGDRCRAIVNLIQVSDGTQVWAREYDFAIGDVLTLQAEMACTVRREIKFRLGVGNPQPVCLALAA